MEMKRCSGAWVVQRYTLWSALLESAQKLVGLVTHVSPSQNERLQDFDWFEATLLLCLGRVGYNFIVLLTKLVISDLAWSFAMTIVSGQFVQSQFTNYFV